MLSTTPHLANSLNQIEENKDEEYTKTLNNNSFHNECQENIIYGNFIGKKQNNHLKANIFLRKTIGLNKPTKLSITTPSSINDSIIIVQFNSGTHQHNQSKPFSLGSSLVTDKGDLLNSQELLKVNSPHANEKLKIISPSSSITYKKFTQEDIKYQEVMNYFESSYMIAQASNPTNEVPVTNSSNKHCCLTKMMRKLLKKYKLDMTLQQDKDLIIYMSQCPFNMNIEIYQRMALLIYKNINDITTIATETGDINHNELAIEYIKELSPLFPVIKEGMFTISKFIMLIDKYPTFIKEISYLCKNEPNSKTILFEMIASIAVLCMEFLQEEEINIYFNKEHNVLETMNNFFLGLLYQVKLHLEKSDCINISSILIEQSIDFARKETSQAFSRAFWKSLQFKEKYIEKQDSISLAMSEA